MFLIVVPQITDCRTEFIFSRLNLEALLDSINGILLEVNADKTNYIFMSLEQNAGQNLNI
jgi:hypothetical protein